MVKCKVVILKHLVVYHKNTHLVVSVFQLIPLAFSTNKSIRPFLGHVNDNKADDSESGGLSDDIQISRLRRGLLLLSICFCY